jgi:hypothetical protein
MLAISSMPFCDLPPGLGGSTAPTGRDCVRTASIPAGKRPKIVLQKKYSTGTAGKFGVN